MNYANLVQLISTVGFPIAVCFACFTFITKTMNGLQEVIAKNTEAVVQLTNYVKGKE